MSVRQSGCQLIKYSGRLSQFNLSVEQILSQSLVVSDFGLFHRKYFIMESGFESNHKSFGRLVGLAEATVKICGSNCKVLRKQS